MLKTNQNRYGHSKDLLHNLLFCLLSYPQKLLVHTNNEMFFAFKKSTDRHQSYEEMLKVSVASARQNTSLELYCLYDGQESELTGWLEARGVRLIYRRSFLYDQLADLAHNRLHNPDVLTIGAGAFLRVEIPQILRELGATDEFVLYTDCDVLFLKDVVPGLARMQPTYFAVSSEFNPTDFVRLNTGVMLMNVPNLLGVDAAFRSFITQNLERFVPGLGQPKRAPLLNYLRNRRFYYTPAWDQSAYQAFFMNRWLGTVGWDKLPVRFNWKPYWGASQDAEILHFHGPKPNQAPLFASGNPPAHLRSIQELATPSYFENSLAWRQILEACHEPLAQ